MKYSAIVATCAVLLNTGCASVFGTAKLEPVSTYNSATDARIKVYRRNGEYDLDIYPNQVPSETIGLNVFGLGSNGLYYKHKNSQKFRYLQAYSGGGRVDNYIIKSGQPLTIAGTIEGPNPYLAGGSGVECRTRYATFTPKAGHNYATYLIDSGGSYDTCAYIQVLELKDDAGVVKEVPVKDVMRIGFPEAAREYKNKSK